MANSNSAAQKENVPVLKKLSILVEINNAISRTFNLKESLMATLKILQKSYHIKSGAIVLAEDDGINFVMGATIGYRDEMTKTRYKIGEGLTGRIAESGKPIIAPQVSKEPLFLNRMSSWDPKFDREQSFIGVPIILDYETLGVLIVNLAYNAKRDYDSSIKFLTLVASALVQAIRLDRIRKQERKELVQESAKIHDKLKEEFSFHNIIGNSHEMQEVYEKVTQVARADTTVLIRGDSGTGKELIAQAIHYNSLRAGKPFIRVNCAAIPETLIETEFFGHEKGAFTDARTQRKGRFELADGGTIFLDEIGDLSQMTQVKLLRVLQEQEFERVGGAEPIRVDIRVIAATNADLEKKMKENLFREDLYYRLNVFSILMPPLRERPTDVLLLADYFMVSYGRKHGKSIRRISTPAIDMLRQYHWPGNVRELENCIERAVLVCDDQVIHSYHLPPTLQTAESSGTMPRISLDAAVANYEKELILDALKSTRGNRAKTARLLDTTERIIGYKIQKYDIDVRRFKTKPNAE